MDIVNFFETVEGTWFSQRTTHFSPDQPSQTGQTTLHVTRLEPTEAPVVELCQRVSVNADLAIFAYAIVQEGQAKLYGGGTTSPKRTTTLVGLASDDGSSGQFLSQTDQEPAVSGQYQLEDDVLTLNIATDQFQSYERLWYMNPNLRMRFSLVKSADGFNMASFCSEIRRISK